MEHIDLERVVWTDGGGSESEAVSRTELPETSLLQTVCRHMLFISAVDRQQGGNQSGHYVIGAVCAPASGSYWVLQPRHHCQVLETDAVSGKNTPN